MRFPLQQDGDIVSIHFQADTIFHRDGVGLMGGLVKHRGEAKKITLFGLVHDDFLLVVVKGCDPDRSGNQNIRLSTRVADLPYALAGSESLDFDLSRQNRGLFIVKQSEQGNTSQNLGAARHRSTLQPKWI
jgi:hypothetical protein